MLIRYCGGDASGREVPALADRQFAPMVAEEVPDEIGRSLCDQSGEWEEVNAETDAQRAKREKAAALQAEQDEAAEAAATKAADAARKRVAAEQAKREGEGK